MNPTLRRGSRGSHVIRAQQRLAAHGHNPGAADGVFGAKTLAAVKALQQAKRLSVDGVIGPATWAVLTGPTPGEATAEAKRVLTAMGWRVNTETRYRQAVRDFQAMWNLGTPLAVDGIVGAKTLAALRHSARRRADKKGDISAHFNAAEFACKCGRRKDGPYPACRRIWASRALVQGAEKYRSLAGPFTPVSACRCRQHNAAVGGYYRSQHLHGQAMDVVARFSIAQVVALRAFSALGINRRGGTVRHLDNRHLSPDNYPRASGSTSNPYTYYYG